MKNVIRVWSKSKGCGELEKGGGPASSESS